MHYLARVMFALAEAQGKKTAWVLPEVLGQASPDPFISVNCHLVLTFRRIRACAALRQPGITLGPH